MSTLPREREEGDAGGKKRQPFIPLQRHCPDPLLETRGLGPWVGGKAEGSARKKLRRLCLCRTESAGVGSPEQRSCLGPQKVQGKRGRTEGRTWPIPAPLQRAGLEREEPARGAG